MLLGEPVGVERGVHRAHVTDRSAPPDRREARVPASVSYPFAMTFAHDGAQPKLAVLGTGYLGATHAVAMVELGYDVVGLDVDEAKIAQLSAGEVPFFEPGLPELLRKALDSGRLRFTTSYQEVADVRRRALRLRGHAAAQGRVRGRPDLRGVRVPTLAPLLDQARAGRGQVDGAGRHRAPDVRAGDLAGPSHEVEVAWNPEFLREGFAVEDTLHPDRLVFGVRSAAAEQALRAAFAPVIASGTPVVVTDFATAELVKVAANSFLATKISFINAMAEVCEVVRRRRDRAVRGARVRPPDRQAVPARRARLRRRLPAQGHPRVHGQGRGARRARTRWRSCTRSTRSTSGAGPGPSTSAGSCSTATTRASGSASGARRSSPTPTTSATRRRWTWPRRRRSSAPP